MTGYFNFYHSNARLSLWGIDVTVADPGEGPGEPAPLFLDQTEARRPEKKNLLETAPPPLISGWMTGAPHPLI